MTAGQGGRPCQNADGSVSRRSLPFTGHHACAEPPKQGPRETICDIIQFEVGLAIASYLTIVRKIG
jgi:hypothetical protein